jgi:hypothetical protein
MNIQEEKMLHRHLWLFIVLIIFVAPQFWACQKHDETHHAEHPATIEKIEGSELSRVTLSEKAIQRLDLKTDEVREVKVKGSTTPRKVVPYSALIYDPQGNTWIYTSPQSRTFVRQKVEVDFIEGNFVVLNDGPPVGTVVASVAVAELYGAEFEVGH